jgi:phosphoglycerate kinase
MYMRMIDEADVAGRRVLLRADLNVPVADATVTDDTRIRALLPTLNWLLEHKARVIVISHLGRPRGEGFAAGCSLAPVARVLGRLLGQEVALVPEVVGDAARAAALALADGQVMLLENHRFDAR